jgi:hypothetical protein
VTAGGQVIPVNPTDSAQVLERAARLGLRQVWVGPTMAANLDFPTKFSVPRNVREAFKWGQVHPWPDRAMAYGWVPSTEPAGLAPWMGMSRAGEWVDLVIPGWGDDNPFKGARSPGQLLEALALFAKALGLRYRRSPGATGLALMRAVHDGPGGVKLPEAHVAPPGLQGIDSWAPDSWVAPELPTTGFLHAWDVNGMFLAACSSVELGAGVPEHLGGPGRAGRPVFDAGRPGYWRASIKSPLGLAVPFLVDGKLHWYPTPAVELAVELGLTVQLREAWVYPERHRWLEPWYAVLRDAREEFTRNPAPAAKLALAGIKAVYTRSLGRLAGGWLQAGDDTFRPDWRDAVIARARANMHRHLVRVHAANGAAPVALQADTVVFHSTLADHAQAARALGLQVAPQLGKWKYAGSAPVGKVKKPRRMTGGGARALLDALSGAE